MNDVEKIAIMDGWGSGANNTFFIELAGRKFNSMVLSGELLTVGIAGYTSPFKNALKMVMMS